ncbi:MAG: aromatic ring-hydroxylating dioxygenase subunit alpha, partial [Pseudomonadota bacterium]|nr:aromatic ring-hydroxylating dioxygenase subunit alpha [Pseudomonadota bacterium]
MLTAEENDILTQTDAETPMGEYFRRFWQPVALSEELPEPDGAPLRVTVMGENLVAFRDTEGRVGLMDRV